MIITITACHVIKDKGGRLGGPAGKENSNFLIFMWMVLLHFLSDGIKSNQIKILYEYQWH